MEKNTEKTQRKATVWEKALIALFVGFVGVFFLLILILPKHEGELSPNERRILASAPNASFSNIVSGGFSKEVDTWMQDHFPARTAFVTIYSYLNRFTGRNAVENISLGRGGRLFTAPMDASEAAMETNVQRINRFAEENSLNAISCIIPTAGYMLESDLPKPHLTYRDGELVEAIESGIASNVKTISAEKVLKAAGDVSALYYRTDHHLTMEGSYAVYCAVIRELGMEPLEKSEFTKTSYEFYGTSYGQSGLFATPPDTLETWVGAYDKNLTVTTVDGSREETHTGSLDMSCLEDGVVDKYAAYLYSNHGITFVENPDGEGTLMVVKDSYGNAIVPFLAAHYKTIIMVDARSLYYGPGMKTPSELAGEYEVKDLAILTGLDTVAAGTLDWLR